MKRLNFIFICFFFLMTGCVSNSSNKVESVPDYEIYTTEYDELVPGKVIYKVVTPTRYTRKEIKEVVRYIQEKNDIVKIFVHFYLPDMDINNVDYAHCNGLNGEYIVDFSAKQEAMTPVDNQTEVEIGEWTFYDEMGTFKNKLIYSKESKAFYFKSYLPGGGWCDEKIRKIKKQGKKYKIIAKNESDVYILDEDGTMTWKCEGYPDIHGEGIYHKELMKEHYK